MNSVSDGSNLEINVPLYKAAFKGNIEPFKETNQHLNRLVTPIKNTIVNIYITSPSRTPKSTKFVNEILEICPSLLLQRNAHGDTPLHLAAKCGHVAIVEVLIERAISQLEELESGVSAKQQMLRMKNNEGDTALHEAVRNNYIDVVEILTKEDPEFSYSANNFGETPLYIAAEGRSLNVVTKILETCKSASHEGTDGKTALHAAVLSEDLDIVKAILEKKRSLTKETDQNGWIPLHYAAYYGHFSIVQQLLQFDRSSAYKEEKERNMTALHMASSQGHENIMEAIISYCPDCCEMVDDRGWNFLHFAMCSLSIKTLNGFLKNPLLNTNIKRSLLNRKDEKGNTPLHVLAVSSASHGDRRYEDVIGVLTGHSLSLNKKNDSVQDILTYGSAELKQEIQELSKVVDIGPFRRGVIRKLERWSSEQDITKWEKTKDSQMVVSILIATVTFAAAFTMPGGYQNEEGPQQGTSVLIRNAAFEAFVITDAVAMMFSLSAVFAHFVASKGEIYLFLPLIRYAFFFTLISMVAMILAFITGIYAVLAPSPGLAISTCTVCLSFFLSVLYLSYKIGKRLLEARP